MRGANPATPSAKHPRFSPTRSPATAVPGSGGGSGSGLGRMPHETGAAGPQGSLAARRPASGCLQGVNTEVATSTSRLPHLNESAAAAVCCATHGRAPCLRACATFACQGLARLLATNPWNCHRRLLHPRMRRVPLRQHNCPSPLSSADNPQPALTCRRNVAAMSHGRGADAAMPAARPQPINPVLAPTRGCCHWSEAARRIPRTTGSGRSSSHSTPRFSPTPCPVPENRGPRLIERWCGFTARITPLPPAPSLGQPRCTGPDRPAPGPGTPASQKARRYATFHQHDSTWCQRLVVLSAQVRRYDQRRGHLPSESGHRSTTDQTDRAPFLQRSTYRQDRTVER